MLLRVIVIAVLLILVLRAIRLLLKTAMEVSGTLPKDSPRSAPTRLARDPVCGTHVPTGTALSLSAQGTTYYFCSEDCRARFSKKSA